MDGVNKWVAICCFIIISGAAQLNIGASAATYNVGDKLGWTIPPLGEIAYKTWAAEQDFAVGDTIVFTWSNTHTVAQLSSKSDYDNCNAANTIGAIQTSSPATFTIDNSTAPLYFICTVGNHCNLGQKVIVTVGSEQNCMTRGSRCSRRSRSSAASGGSSAASGGSSAASATSCALSAVLFAMGVFIFSTFM